MAKKVVIGIKTLVLKVHLSLAKIITFPFRAIKGKFKRPITLSEAEEARKNLENNRLEKGIVM